tara:strand:+ start:563 stop:895 length:333 start_codon:yes stop_codon:yes gene_type:complete
MVIWQGRFPAGKKKAASCGSSGLCYFYYAPIVLFWGGSQSFVIFISTLSLFFFFLPGNLTVLPFLLFKPQVAGALLFLLLPRCDRSICYFYFSDRAPFVLRIKRMPCQKL